MPPRRRLYRKKPAMRRRRPAYRSRFKPRRTLVGSTYRFKRLTKEIRIAHFAGAAANTFVIEDPANILNSATAPAWAAESMPSTYQNQFAVVNRLNQLEIPGDFTQLFDRYKITGVKATFMFQISEAAIGGASILPTILYAADYDDDLPPSYSLMRQKQNVKQRILTANKPFSIFYKPRMSGVATGDLATVAGATSVKPQWIDTGITNIDHYGLKFSINNMYSTASVNSQLEIKFTYYIAMKDPQ